MSFKIPNLLIRFLVPAALLLHLGAAAAADSTDSVLQLQREVLAGRTATALAPPQTQSVHAVLQPSDTQELVQQQLLGTRNQAEATRAADAPAVAGRDVYTSGARSDLQVLAQRLLLGSRSGAAGS